MKKRISLHTAKYKGESVSLSIPDWCKILHISKDRAYGRIGSGQSVNKALGILEWNPEPSKEKKEKKIKSFLYPCKRI